MGPVVEDSEGEDDSLIDLSTNLNHTPAAFAQGQTGQSFDACSPRVSDCTSFNTGASFQESIPKLGQDGSFFMFPTASPARNISTMRPPSPIVPESTRTPPNDIEDESDMHVNSPREWLSEASPPHEGASMAHLQLPSQMVQSFSYHDPNLMFPAESTTSQAASSKAHSPTKFQSLRTGLHSEIVTPQPIYKEQAPERGSRSKSAALNSPERFVEVPFKSSHQSIAHSKTEESASPISSKKRKRHSSTGQPRGKRSSSPVQLQSDEVEVGLPKERYVPRPSRRRSRRETTEERRGQDEAVSDKLDHPAPQLGLDEIEIGLPKERYVPRPTRRRTRPDTIDESKEPKEITSEDTKPQSSKHSIAFISEMGFTTSQARQALEQESGKVESAVNLLLSGALAVTDSGITRHGTLFEEKGSRHDATSSQKAQSNFDPAEDEVNVDETSSLQPKTCDIIPDNVADQWHHHSNVHVVIPVVEPRTSASPGKSNRGRKSSKRKRAKTAPHRPRANHFVISDNDDEEELQNMAPNSVEAQREEPCVVPNQKRRRKDSIKDQVELHCVATPDVEDKKVSLAEEKPLPPAKRSRGRPKSIRKDEEEEARSTVPDKTANDNQSEWHGIDGTRERTTTPLRDLDSNAPSTLQRLDVSPKKPTSEKAVPTSSPQNRSDAVDKENEISLQNEARGKGVNGNQEKPIKNSAGAHSPLSKGAVSYRVGLSRRSKIPSLLTIKRK